GVLLPRFLVGGTELPPELLKDDALSRGTSFRGGVRQTMIVSGFVPPALRPWLNAAEKMGSALVFPPEAVPKLAATTESLVSRGLAEPPKEALGAELPYAPTAALRVEWRAEGAAVVELLVSVHPGAPLVSAGKG